MTTFDHIPNEMRERQRWCWHRLEPKPQDPDKFCPKCGTVHPGKVPRHPRPSGAGVSSTNPAEWRSFENVRQVPPGLDGISYVLVAEDGIVCIDLDHCRGRQTGVLDPWAADIVDRVDSYTEVSASGCGVHIFVRATLPEGKGIHRGNVELYSTAKIIAMTGDGIFPYETLESRDIKWLVDQTTGKSAAATPSTGDQSADDFKLACKLARELGGDAVKVRAAFLQQAIQRPKLQRKDYVDATVRKACEQNKTAQWRDKFHTVDELPDGDIDFLIDNFLPYGVAFVGALSGAGKTWFCLSLAHAITTGQKLMDNWSVPVATNVLYLCPEMSAKAFKKRCRKFGIGERFWCQTISDGAPLDLADAALAQAVKELKPVVFLDTAIRFSGAEDENSSSQNAQGMAKAVFALLALGARAVVCLHHRAKASAETKEMTLENVLRGTGDLGAMCDVVWGLQYDDGGGAGPQYMKDSRRLLRLQARCVKARDFIPPDDFRLQLAPFIDEVGDMRVLADDEPSAEDTEIDRLRCIVRDNPAASDRELEKLSRVGRNRIAKLRKAGKLTTTDEMELGL